METWRFFLKKTPQLLETHYIKNFFSNSGFQQINGINSDDLRDLIDSQLDYGDDFSQVNNNLSDLSQADVDYIKQQHQEALAQGLLPQPGSGGRGRSRANKTGPPPVEPLTQEQLQSLQQGSGNIVHIVYI